MSPLIHLEETTLRDGEQSPGVNFSKKDKIDIALALSEILTEDDVIDAGFPAISQLEHDSVRAVAESVRGPHIMGLSRLVTKDIDAVYSALQNCEKRSIGLIIPTSPIHRKIKLRMSKKSDLVDYALEAVAHARRFFPRVEIGFEDGTRTERDFIYSLTEKLTAAGVHSITIADTIGCTDPWSYGQIFKDIRNQVPNIDQLPSLGAHCHDDLGLALANSIAALREGATRVGCAFNGLGERAGNAATEEIILFFKVHSDILQNPNSEHYGYHKMISCSHLVEERSGIAVPSNKAVVGTSCHMHESGIHQDGVLKDPNTYQPYDPKLLGYDGPVLVLGKHSGRQGLLHQLKKLGILVDDLDIDLLFKDFKVLAGKSRQVSDSDLAQLVETCRENHPAPLSDS